MTTVATMLVRVQFAQPWILVGVAAAVVPAALAIRARRRGRHAGSFCVLLQCLSILAAAVALARPAVRMGGAAARPVLVLRDVSGSVRAQADTPLDWPDGLPRETFDFAATVTSAGGQPAQERTCVAPALRLAAARASGLAGVVIRTDGRFHDDDWPAAARALGRTGTKVFVIPVESPPADARISEFAARRGADEAVRLRVTVASNSLQQRTLAVWRSGRSDTPLLRRRLQMTAGDSATFRLTDSPPADRAVVYRAALAGGDAFPENDAAAAAVWPRKQRVALVGRPGADLAAGLAAAGLTVVSLAPRLVPDAPSGWADYAAVAVVDATGNLLAAPQRAALERFVVGGGGLLLIGAGPHGSPADRLDPLNRVAALIANPYQRRPVKVTVVLDASGSMAEQAEGLSGRRRVKFDQAAQAVLSLRRHLTAGDGLAVIAFSDSPRRIYDSGSGEINFALLRDALAKVRPGGPTRVRPALKLAAAGTVAPPRRRLVLVVSDLLTEPFDAAEIAERFRSGQISVAIIATRSGDPSPVGTTPLEAFAGTLGAPLIRRDGLAGLAEVFAGFLRRSRGSAIRRGRFRVSGEARPGSGGPPALDAYILSAPAGEAQVLLQVGADPLLARRPAGLGRSAALAVPLGPNDNAAWKRSGYLGELLAANLRWAMRPANDPRLAGRVVAEGGALRIVVDAQEAGVPVNLLKLTARVLAQADAAPREAPLAQTAPGRYEAVMQAAGEPLGVHVLDSSGRVLWVGPAGAAVQREFANIGADFPALYRLAELAGGRVIRLSGLPAWQQALVAARYVDTWPWLLAFATATMLLEWSIWRIRRRGQ